MEKHHLHLREMQSTLRLFPSIRFCRFELSPIPPDMHPGCQQDAFPKPLSNPFPLRRCSTILLASAQLDSSMRFFRRNHSGRLRPAEHQEWIGASFREAKVHPTRTARTGAASAPITLRGRQMSWYLPGGTASRSMPSRIKISFSRRQRCTGARSSPYRSTDR